MITYIDDLEQGTPEWLHERMGIMTGSVVKNILTSKLQLSQDKKVKILALELAAQRITGKVLETPTTRDMTRGHIEEDIAKSVYNEHYEKTHDCGFITNTNMGFKFGFSPDGLVGNDGFIEVKSRLPKYQVKTIYEDAVPSEYMAQIQTGFVAMERDWCDFIQFSNGMPLFVKRVFPDLEVMGIIRSALTQFELQIEEAVRVYEKNSEGLVPTEYVEHDYSFDFVGEKKEVFG